MFLAAMAALAMLASCDKHTDEIAESATGSVVKITLTDKTPATTRAFFGATAAAESWEKEIKTLTLYVTTCWPRPKPRPKAITEPSTR